MTVSKHRSHALCGFDLRGMPSVPACEQALLQIPVGRSSDEMIGPQDQPQRTSYCRLPKRYYYGECTTFSVWVSMPYRVRLERQMVDICCLRRMGTWTRLRSHRLQRAYVGSVRCEMVRSLGCERGYFRNMCPIWPSRVP